MNEFKTREQQLKFYKSAEWQRLRKKALARDNFECVWCRENGRVTTTNLEVDHIYEIEKHPDKAKDLDLLRTLCTSCHNKRHKRFGKFTKSKPKFETPERW